MQMLAKNAGIILLGIIALTTSSSFSYNKSAIVPVSTDKIVWSDERYVELYGQTISVVMDFQQGHQRYRNNLNFSQSNVTIDGKFRAKGRTESRTITPLCQYQNSDNLTQLTNNFFIDGSITYFIIENPSLKIGVLDEKCSLTTYDLGDDSFQGETKVIGIDTGYFGIATGNYFYLINKLTNLIFQKISLSPCWNELLPYQVTYQPSDSNSNSFLLSLTTPNTMCIFSRSSNQSILNFLNSYNHNLGTYPSYASFNYTTGFIFNRNCEIIQLNFSVAGKSQNGSSATMIQDEIVGKDIFYGKSTNWYPSTLIFTSKGIIKRISAYGASDFYSISKVNGKVICGCYQGDSDNVFSYFVDADNILKYSRNSGDVLPMNSSSLPSITAISCNGRYINTTNVGVIAGTVSNGQLLINYLDGWNYLRIKYALDLPPDQQFLLAIHRSVDYITIDKYTLNFVAVVNSTASTKYTCYTFNIQDNTMILLGSYKIGSDYQFMNNNGVPSYLFWHELVKDQHYLFRMDFSLAITQYPMNDDYYSFNVGYFAIRILRKGGRSDLYASIEPKPINRLGSIITQKWNDEKIVILCYYDYTSGFIFIQKQDQALSYSISSSDMFIRQTFAIMPSNICSNSILPPIISSISRDTFALISSPFQNNIPILNITEFTIFYSLDSFKMNNSAIKLTYDLLNQQIYTLKNYLYVKEANTIFVHAALNGKEYLFGIRLHYLQTIRNYLIWDWIYPLEGLNLKTIQGDGSSVAIYAETQSNTVNGTKIIKIPSVGRTRKDMNGFNLNTLPYLVSRGGSVAMFLGYNNDASYLVDINNDQTLFNFSRMMFYSISPNGLFLAEKDFSQSKILTVYRQNDLLGRINLINSLTESSKVEFMSDSILLQMTPQNNNRILDLFSFKEGPFSYASYSYIAKNINKDGWSFNSTHIAIQTTERVIILDSTLTEVQSLSLSPMQGKEPDSVSISDSGILYAKYGDELFVWLSEECPNSQVNNEGICEDPSLSGGSIIAIVAGCVGGAVGLGIIGVILYRRKKVKKESSLINSEDRTV